jgi:hypothetical protein
LKLLNHGFAGTTEGLIIAKFIEGSYSNKKASAATGSGVVEQMPCKGIFSFQVLFY